MRAGSSESVSECMLAWHDAIGLHGGVIFGGSHL